MTDEVLAKVDHTMGTPCLQTPAVVISTKSTMMSFATADPSPNPHELQNKSCQGEKAVWKSFSHLLLCQESITVREWQL